MSGVLQFMDKQKAEEMRLLEGMSQEQIEDYVAERRYELYQEKREEEYRKLLGLEEGDQKLLGSGETATDMVEYELGKLSPEI